MLPKLSFVLGGAASGKSRFAEGLVQRTGKSKIYIATAQAFDDEMHAKIADHKKVRGADWHTIEAPLDITGALKSASPDNVVLIDCVTLWLSNLLLDNADVTDAQAQLLAGLSASNAPVVIVSNEVGQGIVPETSLGRRFREAQGRLNTALAAQADLAVLVTAGLPQVLKGSLP